MGDFVLEKLQVEQAVAALLTVVRKSKDAGAGFLQEADKINLQFTFKKIPKLDNKVIKLNLPHSTAGINQDVCLFVKDLTPKKERDYAVTVRHFTDLLKKNGIHGITEIIPLRALKTEYKPYEAKKNLSNRFDIFVADVRIVRLLPTLLGKNFFGRKRHPVQVNLEAKDLKKELQKALANSRCIISGRGSSSMATVAHTQMSEAEIVDNILSSANQIVSTIPGGSDNIRNFHIKTADSLSLPIYCSLGSVDTVTLPAVVIEKKSDVIGDVTTVEDGQVLVTPMGDVMIVNAASEKRKQEPTGKQTSSDQPPTKKKKKVPTVPQQEIDSSVTVEKNKSKKPSVKESGVASKKPKVTKLTKSSKRSSSTLRSTKTQPKKLSLRKKVV